MVILCIVELRCRPYLSSDRPKSACCERHLVAIAGRLRQPPLLVAVCIDARSILRSTVVALPHALRRVVALPEQCKQVGVGHTIRMKDDPDYFGVAGRSTAHLLVRRVLCVSRRVADLRTATALRYITLQTIYSGLSKKHCTVHYGN